MLDSNVLLQLYQYAPSALEEFFKVLEKVKDRLWLPHQAALEFHRNRAKSLPEQRSKLERVIKTIDKMLREVDTLGLPEYHPVLDIQAAETVRDGVSKAFDALRQHIQEALQKTPEFNPESILHGEPIREHITQLFENRVGDTFTPAQLENLYKEGGQRYARSIPPGYMDQKKGEPGCYGDLIVWRQLLEHQKTRPAGEKGALFICDDRKEDWWFRKDNARLGPRPELIREFLEAIGEDFYMYTPADFLKEAPRFLALFVSAAAIEDVKRVAQFSPIESVLRAQRMVLPDAPTRDGAIAKIYDVVSSGKLRVAGDLNAAIEGIGGPFISNYVATQLFFSLVNETYGPVRATPDPALPLRERSIHLTDAAASREAFLRLSHAAWLAQALFRVRYERFSDDELLVAFFGPAPSQDDRELLARANSFVELDIAYRGR